MFVGREAHMLARGDERDEACSRQDMSSELLPNPDIQRPPKLRTERTPGGVPATLSHSGAYNHSFFSIADIDKLDEAQ